MSNESDVILPSDDRSARLVTVTGWVSRHGQFFGDSEDSARYHGATHSECVECGAPVRKGYMRCDNCIESIRNKNYAEMERKPWDGTTAIYSDDIDEFFNDADALADYCDEHDIDPLGLRLVHCKLQYGRTVDFEAIYDYFPEFAQDAVPDEIFEAVEALNKLITSPNAPCVWEPTKVAVDIDASGLLFDAERLKS